MMTEERKERIRGDAPMPRLLPETFPRGVVRFRKLVLDLEVLKMAFRAVLPAMRRAGSAQQPFDQVRDALETAGLLASRTGS